MKIFVAFMMTVILLPNSKAQFTAQAAAGRGQYTITTTQGLEFQSLIYYVPSVYNTCGELEYRSILTQKETLTSIRKLDFQFSIKSFPNPTTDWVTIAWNKTPPNYTIEITSLLGAKIFIKPLSDALTQKINLTHFAAGVYMLTIHTSNQSSYSTKIIKS